MRWNRLYINNNYNNYPLKDKNLTLDRANKFSLFSLTRFFALSFDKIGCISEELFHASMKVLLSICTIFAPSFRIYRNM